MPFPLRAVVLHVCTCLADEREIIEQGNVNRHLELEFVQLTNQIITHQFLPSSSLRLSLLLL